MVVFIILAKTTGHDEDVFLALPYGDFNIRWYHVFNIVAFLVANVWNFQLNRSWTFKSGRHAGWWREFFPFLAVGSVSAIVGLVLVTLLRNPTSPLHLPMSIFDSSSGLRDPKYWAQLISVFFTMPINFVVNKLWTFRAVRGKRLHPEQELPMVAAVVAPEVVDEEGNPIPEGTVHEDTIHDDSVRDGSGDTERG
ncbi:polysaccharide synthesis protein GtrA [Enemella evansiae]|uniref:Polysaccharide synthesis protein GtrA n=2 Tax=Enemella evansiae TaxID=2016499 RepID=A0A255G1E7_9ACTN|nr:polysaccharide synthesis protein GtrA [Enemella evansiae]